MSEADYQRGLRGGDCPVSISDYKRWKDWKDGNDEFERREDAELEKLITQGMTTEQKFARYEARKKERDEEERRHEKFRKDSEIQSIQSKIRSEKSDVPLGIFLILGGCLLGALVIGFILKLIIGIPLIVSFILAIIIAWWRIDVEVIKPYHKNINELEDKLKLLK